MKKEELLSCVPVLLTTLHKRAMFVYSEEQDVLAFNHGNSTMMKPAEMYLTSKREAKKGEYVIRFDQNVEIIREVDDTHYFFKDRKYCARKESCTKIEATTDTSLGLPKIPNSFLVEYVKRYDKPRKMNGVDKLIKE